MSKSKKRVQSQRPRARAARPAQSRDFPWLPVVVGAAFAVVLLGMVAYVRASSPPPPKADPILCQSGEQLAAHYHAHLDILNGGQKVQVPAFVGITTTCLYWLHTHDSSGDIHIEAPVGEKDRKFTLGDFFDIWQQPLNSRQAGPATVGPGQSLVTFVDGKAYQGNPRSIVLRAHEVITLEIAPPRVDPPPSYRFPAGE